MADTRRSRAALRGARTRERNVSLHGPSIKKSSRAAERERGLKGGKTLSDAYMGVPNRTDFLAKADLVERSIGGKRTKTDRAIIVPKGLQTLSEKVETLYVYRRDKSVRWPRRGELLNFWSATGGKYEIESLEEISGPWQEKVGGRSYARHCTAVAQFRVRKAAPINLQED